MGVPPDHDGDLVHKAAKDLPILHLGQENCHTESIDSSAPLHESTEASAWNCRDMDMLQTCPVIWLSMKWWSVKHEQSPSTVCYKVSPALWLGHECCLSAIMQDPKSITQLGPTDHQLWIQVTIAWEAQLKKMHLIQAANERSNLMEMLSEAGQLL
ncbi:hypothetical protein WJX74_001380 [Apatococcus lobatus]|uniref:Uncharacterized protein n=1 Tax=Apatococcus lobatus TaxID=904363 RepID=A0AAW1Q7D5_9CHLO